MSKPKHGKSAGSTSRACSWTIKKDHLARNREQILTSSQPIFITVAIIFSTITPISLPLQYPTALANMPSAGKSATISAIALAAMVQFCPAPFLALIPEAVAVGLGAVSGVIGAAGGIAGAVEGGIAASHSRARVRQTKRQQQNPQAWNDRHGQLGSATVTFSAPAVGSTSTPLIATKIVGVNNN